ncbi:hypothetical protein ASG52_19710 [Methylobacterium sp. Leaf456]|uniref:hypothetical protein n=1 Tax=Methylobacterium sp. Leaf456 TaxID=1736382 RepID=UPI000701B3B9|nr:hypothetical protein [Methylobacterium sp. Leaf456]KQT59954.1 hypothetical protein ASG52_19710 [Methylobacterium sp. Leaf456]
MASERETIAEIEAILREHIKPCTIYLADTLENGVTGIPEAAAAIAALRSKDREREDGAREEPEFRVGHSMLRNVYRGDDGIFMARTEAEAAELVALLNAGRAALEEQEGRDA